VDFAPTMLSLVNIPIPEYMQGRAFLGSQKAPPRQYIFAARDRMDPVLDTQRAVRDRRFKYIRNYHPEKPYVQFLPYRDQMPLMQELLRLDREGKLDDIQKLWFRKTKPVEELYDTFNDPYEIKNLADDPNYQDVLKTLQAKLSQWEEECHDLGHIPETELVKKMWPPDGIQPRTAAPVFETPSSEFESEMTITLSCPTNGASIAYKFENDKTWRLYSAPFAVDETTTITAQAIRIGFKPSEEVQQRFVKRN